MAGRISSLYAFYFLCREGQANAVVKVEHYLLLIFLIVHFAWLCNTR